MTDEIPQRPSAAIDPTERTPLAVVTIKFYPDKSVNVAGFPTDEMVTHWILHKAMVATEDWFAERKRPVIVRPEGKLIPLNGGRP